MTRPTSKSARDGRPLRIVHVAPQLSVGGLERLLVDIARNASRDCYELQFVSLSDRGTLATDIEREGWKVHALRIPPGLRPASILRLALFFRRNRFDVLHTHNDKALFYAAPAARLAGLPHIVHTRHGQSSSSSHRIKRAFHHACRLVRQVACVSEDSAQLCRAAGVPTRKVVTIRNGVDTERFSYGAPQSNGPILMIGRLCPEKNVILLLRAFEKALGEESNLQLVIVGDGRCRSELQAAAGDLGISARVNFLGESNEVVQHLKKASMFVLPSLTEGVSLTLLEAMAVGLPTVATNVGGNSEVVVERVTGYLVASNDVPSMAKALLRVWREPLNSRRMGAAGRKRVVEHFSLRQMLNQYDELYRRVCPEKLLT